jgi:hypothetical protein
MSFVSAIIGTADRVPLPDVLIRAAIHRLCSRTAIRLATGNTESDACSPTRWPRAPLPITSTRPTPEIEDTLHHVYGSETALWMRRWRWFFLATSGLFGYADGNEWGVSDYRMRVAS